MICIAPLLFGLISATYPSQSSIALLEASEIGRLDLVKEALSEGGELDCKGPDGWTPLMLAIIQGHSVIAKELVMRGARLDIENDSGMTAIKLLIEKQDTAMLSAMVEGGMPIDDDGLFILSFLNCHEFDECFDRMVSLDYNLDRNFGDACNFLIGAMAMGRWNMAQRVIEAGANVNLDDSLDVDSPLIISLMAGQTDITEMLIKRGAYLDVLQRNNGLTALMYAIESGLTEIAVLMIEAGADVNLASPCGWTPIHLAIQNESTEVVRALVRFGADIDSPLEVDYLRLTPLMRAAMKDGGLGMVGFLVENGAKLDAVDASGRTAAGIARWAGNIRTFSFLISLAPQFVSV